MPAATGRRQTSGAAAVTDRDCGEPPMIQYFEGMDGELEVLLQVFGYQLFFYLGVETLERNPHNVMRPIDSRIPLLPWTVLIYVTWFPLIIAFPIFAHHESLAWFYRYVVAIVADMVISIVIYLIYPTSFVRPEPPDTIGGRLLKGIYKGSFKGYNCAPSMHCSESWIVMICAILCPGLDPIVRAVFIALPVLITISTQTTKQHVLIDVITAIPVTVISLIIGAIDVHFWI